MTRDEELYREEFDLKFNLPNLKKELEKDGGTPTITIGSSRYVYAPLDDEENGKPHYPFHQNEHGVWMIALMNIETRSWNSLYASMLSDDWVNSNAKTIEDMKKLFDPPLSMKRQIIQQLPHQKENIGGVANTIIDIQDRIAELDSENDKEDQNIIAGLKYTIGLIQNREL